MFFSSIFIVFLFASRHHYSLISVYLKLCLELFDLMLHDMYHVLTNPDFAFLILILLGCWFFLHVFIVSLIQNHYFHILLQMSCTFSCYNRINRHLAYTTMQKMLNLLNQRIMSVVVYIVLFKNWVFKLNYQCRYVIMFWPK